MEQSKEEVMGLTVTGNADLGRELIELARATHRRDAQKKVVEAVKRLLASIDEQKSYIEAATKSIAVLNMRLEALKTGNFTISNKGELVLDDKNLAPLGLDK